MHVLLKRKHDRNSNKKKPDGLSQMIIFIVLYPFLKRSVMQELFFLQINNSHSFFPFLLKGCFLNDIFAQISFKRFSFSYLSFFG